MQRVVISMKWGSLYGAEYVNVLYRATRAHITGPFRFICLTDDPKGIDPNVECYPIPDIGLKPEHWRAGAWPKVAVFLHDLYGLEGRALFIDLDMVIWGNIDAFFTHGAADDAKVVMLDSAPWRYKNQAPRPMSSIFAFELGSLGFLVDRLRASRDEMVRQYGIEQNFIGGEAGQLAFWPQDWIQSYKYHLRQPLFIDRLRGPTPPPASVKVLCFHGQPRPIDLIRPPQGNWDRFPHYGKGRVQWMSDYWTQNGGSISPSLQVDP